MSALFFSTLGQIPYNVALTYEENLDQINENFPEYLSLLEKRFPISDPSIKIYYFYAGDMLIPTEYKLSGSISPKDILASVSNFYQHQLTEDEAAYLIAQGFLISAGEHVYEFLGERYHSVGLIPYEDGYQLNLE